MSVKEIETLHKGGGAGGRSVIREVRDILVDDRLFQHRNFAGLIEDLKPVGVQPGYEGLQRV